MRVALYILLLYLLNFYGAFGQISTYKRKINKGNEYFDQKKYDEAGMMYKEALSKRKNKPTDEALYNYGNSAYKLNNFDQAISIYENITHSAYDKKIRSKAYHNLGNSYYQKKDYNNALEAYRRALTLNPDDPETQYNYARTYTMIKRSQSATNNNSQTSNDQKEESSRKNLTSNNGDRSDKKITMDDKILENLLKYIESKDHSVQEKVRNKTKKTGKKDKNEKDW